MVENGWMDISVIYSVYHGNVFVNINGVVIWVCLFNCVSFGTLVIGKPRDKSNKVL